MTDGKTAALGNFMSQFTKVFRTDSWQNLITGLGVATRDKVKSTEFLPSNKIAPATLEALYRGDDLVTTLCDTVPEEMLRKGFDVDVSDEKNKGREHEFEENCQSFIKKHDVIKKTIDALVWAKLYGGSALFPIVDDGISKESLVEPLELERIRDIKGINVIEGQYMQPATWYEDATEEKYGEIKTWRIMPYTSSYSASLQNLEVHETRLIIFNGARATVRTKQQNNGFSDSLVQRVYDVIQMYTSGWQSVGHLMSDANQAVFKIKDLISMIATENSSAITTRMQIVDMCRSAARAIAIDADSEDFQRHPTNFAGIEQILQMFSLRLSSAFRMPATILMGQSPAGENATGDADFRWFYDRVESAQANDAEPKLRRLFEIAFAAKNGPTEGIVPEKWSIVFRPLQRMTEAEQANIRKTQAETDHIYITDGVVLDHEVTLSRFTRDGWKSDTNVDLDLRKEMVDLEKDRELENLKNPPEPPVPVPGAVPGKPAQGVPFEQAKPEEGKPVPPAQGKTKE